MKADRIRGHLDPFSDWFKSDQFDQKYINLDKIRLTQNSDEMEIKD